MQLDRHGGVALEYWQMYRPRALAELGDPLQQEEFFYRLGLRVTEQIGQLADQMLGQLPAAERAGARMAVRAQAMELVYEQEVYLPKEPGTEDREI